MKASRLIAELASMIQENGDFDLMVARDPEGNGRPNTPEGVYLVFYDKDDPENLYDTFAEAINDCDDVGASFYIGVK